MKLTPAIKGQLTKAVKQVNNSPVTDKEFCLFNLVRDIFMKHMPAEQAKHATRKYLVTVHP